MVRFSGVPWLAEPLLPRIVTELGPPVVALRLAVIVRVDVPVVVTGLGLKLALTPLGSLASNSAIAGLQRARVSRRKIRSSEVIRSA